MRANRSIVLAVSALSVSVFAVTGCGVATDGSTQSSSGAKAAAPAVALRAASVADTNCKDGKNQVASLAPGAITADPSTVKNSTTLARIRKTGHLTVGTSSDVKLWGATNPKTGDLEGFDIDVIGEVAKALGLQPNQIVYKVVNYGQRLTSLKSGAVDLVAHTMTINCARWQGANTASAPNPINFSSEYYQAGQRVLVRSDSPAKEIEDLKGQKVCVPAGSTNVGNVEKMGLDLVQLDVIGDCLVKFQEGEVVAITGDDTVLAGFRAQDPVYSKVIGRKFSEEPYGLGINAGDTEFTRYVNAVLEKLRADGTLTKIYKNTMGTAISDPPPAVPQPVYGRDLSKLARQP
jgi:polar amino acid transport system substrate-binding protein